MPLTTQEEKNLLWKNYEDAIGALVDAVFGRKMPPPDSRNTQRNRGAFALSKNLQVGQAVYKYRKKFDSAIREVVHSFVGGEVPDGPYSEAVYEAVLKVAETVQAIQAAYSYRVTDPDEYKVELERRRRIGLTIDPANADTTVSVVDVSNPYGIRDESSHVGREVREYFARHPGGDWIHLGDLPVATNDALWERDGRILVELYQDSHDYYVFVQAVGNERVVYGP